VRLEAKGVEIYCAALGSLVITANRYEPQGDLRDAHIVPSVGGI
jgi:hypothetical protein